MKFSKILFPLLVISCTATSCSLEEEPYGFYSESNFYTNAADAEAAVTYAYDALTYLEYSRSIFTLGTIASEECYPKPDEGADIQNINKWSYGSLSNSGPLNNFFKYAYIAINRTNSVIKNIPKGNLSQSEKDAFMGEAYFLRAWNYFNLVRAFGKVPIHLEVVETLNQTSAPMAKDLDEVYNIIIADCQRSIELLKVNQRLGRIDKVGAQALLSKVYLFIASAKEHNVPLYAQMTRSVPEMYSLSAQTALAALDQSPYGFENNLLDIYDVSKPLGKENIFLLSMDRSGTAEGDYSKISKLFLPYISGSTIYLKNPSGTLTKSHDGWSTYMTEISFFNSFDNSDKRKNDLIVTKTYNASGVENAAYPATIQYPFTRKYVDPDFIGDKTSTKPFLIRYSDVALIYAEAAGPSSQSYQYVNFIRNRAGLGNLNPGLGVNEFRLAIMNERKYELAFEGNRLYDLRRFNMVSQFVPQAAGLSMEQQAFYPIPQIEIDLNENF